MKICTVRSSCTHSINQNNKCTISKIPSKLKTIKCREETSSSLINNQFWSHNFRIDTHVNTCSVHTSSFIKYNVNDQVKKIRSEQKHQNWAWERALCMFICSFIFGYISLIIYLNLWKQHKINPIFIQKTDWVLLLRAFRHYNTVLYCVLLLKSCMLCTRLYVKTFDMWPVRRTNVLNV